MEQGDRLTYYCNACVAPSPRWQSRCPSCHQSAGMRTSPDEPVDPNAPGRPRSKYRRAADISRVRPPRVRTWIEGLDRVLGGDDPGFAQPSTVLFGGGEGAGKSSLALQAAAGIVGKQVLYLMSEEPAERFATRADRLGLAGSIDHILVAETATHDEMVEAVADVRPQVVVVDSLSILENPRTDTPDEQANRKGYLKWFFDDANANARVYLVIMHLNAENQFTGARYLRYVVDAVMSLTKLGKKRCRLECPSKNRWGDIAQVAFFDIGKTGLVEIETDDDPGPVADRGVTSEFLSDR